jgi:ubiquinone/menaquinone biosynthesis C-methylase UbiE
MTSHDGELEAIRRRYERRTRIPADRYSRWNPEVLARVYERQLATTALLGANGIHSMAGLDVLEVGCGDGANLIEFLQLGAEPARLVGNDLLEDRIAHARELLPESVRFYQGDASAMGFDDASFDIVYQSTVFSSILNNPLQDHLAAMMWRWLRPGGAVLWYDFTVDNPRNPDVRGVPLTRVRQLFPAGQLTCRRLTLAPPLARAVTRIHPALYGAFNILPLLRTHILCWIQKT